MAWIPVMPSVDAKSHNNIADAVFIRLNENNKLNLSDPKVVYTVVYTALEEIARWLAKNPEKSLEFGSLIKFYSEKSESEDGEKAGNIVPGAECGERFKLIMKNDDATEDAEED